MRTLSCLATLLAFGLALPVHAAKVGIAESKASKAPAMISAKPIKPQPDPPKFSVASVQQLKSAGLTAIPLRVRGVARELPGVPTPPTHARRVDLGAGHPAYATGDGVVLDFVNPLHEGTGSTLGVHMVSWTDLAKQRVLAGDTSVGIQQVWYGGRRCAAVGHFEQLPWAAHTYVLTVGTSLQPDMIQVNVGTDIMHPGQFFASPETSEIRVPISYAAGGQLEHSGELVVGVYYFDPSVGLPGRQVWFHHIQLAQLD